VRFEAVLFDAVGTLIELREPVGETYARFAREHGVALPAWRIDDAFHRISRQAPPMVTAGTEPAERARCERDGWRRVVRDTFRATDQTARFDDFDGFFERLWRHYAGDRAWAARPGAAALLRELRARGLATAVVSNFDRRLPGVLEALGLRSALDALVVPSDAGAAKPSPRIFQVALSRLGVPAERALYVGDDPEQDLAAARAAGLRAVDVTRLATLEDLLDRLDADPREIE
jgi:putative hydrolase of the HAD superfamily